MPHDARVYAVITHDFADSPKLQVVSVEARWALLEMILYSCRMQTDGVLSKRLAAAKWSLDVCLELASNDAENPSLIETENEWIIHDFLEHQTSKAEIEERRRQKQEAGRKGGLAKRAGKTGRSSRSQAGAKAGAIASAKQTLKQKPSKSKAEIRNKKKGGESPFSGVENTAEIATETPPPPDFSHDLTGVGAAIADAPRVFGTVDDPRCEAHKDLPRDQVPACHACAQARRTLEAREEATRAERRRQVEECNFCDQRGFVQFGAGSDAVLVRCDHNTPPHPPNRPTDAFKPQSDPNTRKQLLDALKRKTGPF